MGCCVSSNNNKKSNSSQQSDQEEETVKEVLSETPTVLQKPTNYTTTQNDHFKISHNNVDEEKHIFKKPIMSLNHPNDHHHSEDQLSDLSGTTIRVGSDPDPDDPPEVRQRSPANHRVNSPVRRYDPSPGRVRPGPGRGPGRVVRGGRRDNGECSGRRSRSPGLRAENGGHGSGLGRSPSVRKTGNSPGRVRSELGDRVRKMEEVHGNGENKWPPTSGNESLENPLVSLECFIFL